MPKLKEWLFGRPERQQSVSYFTPQQQRTAQQQQQAIAGRGAGGAFGQAADYYRDIMDPSSAQSQAFAAPEMRRFQQETIPGLAEQFAGMGAGGLTSSGFQNAGAQAGVDLSERLGAMRAGLQQQGAQGLAEMGQQGLGQQQHTFLRQREPGALETGGKMAANMAANYFMPGAGTIF